MFILAEKKTLVITRPGSFYCHVEDGGKARLVPARFIPPSGLLLQHVTDYTTAAPLCISTIISTGFTSGMK